MIFLWRRSTSRWSCSDQSHISPQILQGLDNGIQPRPHLAVRNFPKYQVVEAGVKKEAKSSRMSNEQPRLPVSIFARWTVLTFSRSANCSCVSPLCMKKAGPPIRPYPALMDCHMRYPCPNAYQARYFLRIGCAACPYVPILSGGSLKEQARPRHFFGRVIRTRTSIILAFAGRFNPYPCSW